MLLRDLSSLSTSAALIEANYMSLTKEYHMGSGAPHMYGTVYSQGTRSITRSMITQKQIASNWVENSVIYTQSVVYMGLWTLLLGTVSRL